MFAHQNSLIDVNLVETQFRLTTSLGTFPAQLLSSSIRHLQSIAKTHLSCTIPTFSVPQTYLPEPPHCLLLFFLSPLPYLFSVCVCVHVCFSFVPFDLLSAPFIFFQSSLLFFSFFFSSPHLVKVLIKLLLHRERRLQLILF